MNIGGWIKRNSSTILTCLGAGGFVSTVVLAIKATPKAMDKIQDAAIAKGEDILAGRREGTVKKCTGGFEMPKLTVLETVMACGKEYLPTVAVGAASLVCIFGSNVLSRRQQASMAAAYTALASAFEGYHDKVKTICGPDTDEMIVRAMEQEKQDAEDDRPPWDEIQTFYLECNGCAPKFFERTMEQVGEDCYILPSSLHELLLIPKSTGFSVEELQEMVESVNSSQLLPEEILSNRVFEYDSAHRKLLVAGECETELEKLTMKHNRSLKM